MLSYAFWSRQFGQDASVIGSRLRLDKEQVTVVGVMPPEFFGIDRGSVPPLWVPLSLTPDANEVWVLARLRPGVTPDRAQTWLDPLFRRAMESQHDLVSRWSDKERNDFFAQKLLVNRATHGTSGVRWDYWDYASTLKVLIGLSGVVLLIACANLANLLMARSSARAREINIRLALGASRARLVSQLMVESLVLSLAGAALGLPVASLGHRLLVTFLVPDPRAVAMDFTFDYRLLAFTLMLSIATGLLFGLVPALRATRAGRDGASYGRAYSAGPSRPSIAKGLLVVQFSLSTILLIGAGLFAKSLYNLGTAELGLARSSVILMDVSTGLTTPDARRQFWTAAANRIGGIPGVRMSTLAGNAVYGKGGWGRTIWIERQGQPAESVNVRYNAVGPGFFATTGIPILIGREFGAQDRDGVSQAAVVNQAFARSVFGDANPIGKRFGDKDNFRRYEIAGVVADAKIYTAREKTRPMVFLPLEHGEPRESCVLHVNTASDPATLAAAIRREILTLDNDALAGKARTLPEIVHRQTREDRMLAMLASFFAGLALALGGIGIYGIVAYRVHRRTTEIGVRMALGAQKTDVLWLMTHDTLLLLALGVCVGVFGGLAANRLVKSILFGLEPSDPSTIACAIAILLATGVCACLIPALRATRIDPMEALRHE